MKTSFLIFGLPWQSFLPGLALIAIVIAVTWIRIIRQQNSAAAKAVKSLGWTYEGPTEFEGPLIAGLSMRPQFRSGQAMPLPPPGGIFQFTTGGDLSWARRDQVIPASEDTQGRALYFWQFRALYSKGFHPLSDVQINWPEASTWEQHKSRWAQFLSGLMRCELAPEQLQLLLHEDELIVVVLGFPIDRTEEAIRLANACVQQLCPP